MTEYGRLRDAGDEGHWCVRQVASLGSGPSRTNVTLVWMHKSAQLIRA